MPPKPQPNSPELSSDSTAEVKEREEVKANTHDALANLQQLLQKQNPEIAKKMNA